MTVTTVFLLIFFFLFFTNIDINETSNRTRNLEIFFLLILKKQAKTARSNNSIITYVTSAKYYWHHVKLPIINFKANLYIVQNIPMRHKIT